MLLAFLYSFPDFNLSSNISEVPFINLFFGYALGVVPKKSFQGKHVELGNNTLDVLFTRDEGKRTEAAGISV